MNIKTATKMKIALAVAVLFTVTVLVTMYIYMKRVADESAKVRETLTGLNNLAGILIKIQAIETGQRGYIISGDTAFLRGYSAALATLNADLSSLEKLPAAGRVTATEVSNLKTTIDKKVAAAKLSVEKRKVNGFDSAAVFVQDGSGQRLMTDILRQLSSAEEKERRYLVVASNERATYAADLTRLYFILAALFVITAVGGYFFITADFRKSAATNKLLQYNSTLLRNISDAIITTDGNDIITDWNGPAEMMYGYSDTEAKGKQLSQLLRAQPTGSGLDEVAAVLKKEEIWKGDVLHFNKEGETIHAQISSTALKSPDGEFIGTITVARDISEKVKLNNELQQLSERLQVQVNRKVNELNLFFERIADAFIALDNDWNYTYLNKAAVGFHQKELSELLGKNIWEVFPEVVNGPFYQALHEAKRTQQPQRKELYYALEDRWYEDLIYPGKDGISVYYRDISEKKKAEEELRRSQDALRFSNDRFELVAKATNDAIWDWDIEKDIVAGNESFHQLFNLPPGKVINYGEFIERLHPDDRERIRLNFFAKVKKKEPLVTEEFRFRMASGVYNVVYDRAYILYNSEGRGYRMLGALQDITGIKETEQKLTLEKELSDSVINSLPGIFYLYTQEGKFLRWNNNFESVSGYSAEEIKEMHPLNFFIAEEKALLTEKITNVFKTGSDNVEASFLTKSGNTVPYYFTGMVISYEGEVCLMGVGLDISEKLRSQKDLVESEEKFRTLVQQASDGIAITDDDANFIDVNESFAILTGYTREELLGMTGYEIFHDENTISKPFRYHEMMRGIVILTERVIKRKNGRFVNVEVSGKQLDDGRFQAIIRDITERKAVEEALKLSERKYRLLFNENPLPMWIFSLPEKKFLDVNSAAVAAYGYSKKDFLTLDVSAIDPVVNTSRAGSADSGESFRHEGIRDHFKKSGDIIKVNVIAHTIVYEGKSAVLVLANDITDKFLAEENLQKSHEALRELASHLETIREAERTHMAREIHDELGQQLTGLKMDISWLSRKIKSEDDAVNEKLRDTIELIDKTVITVRRIATQLRPSILDDLGLVAAMEWQSEEFEKRSDIKAVFSANISHADVKPEIATPVFRIFQESLTNVLRHSGATQVISSLVMERNTITLCIEDNGTGFKEEEIALKKTLGLLGMKERVLLINGTYSIKGDSGNGTSVIITVPLN